MLYKGNWVYEGEWKNDYKEGKGFESFTNGNVYIGEFHKGRP